MDYVVDSILDNWFGEPVAHSDDEENRIRNLYNPLRKMEKKLRMAEERIRQLERKEKESSWDREPDRMGGQYTDEERLREATRDDAW